jgi:hypothetical protein
LRISQYAALKRPTPSSPVIPDNTSVDTQFSVADLWTEFSARDCYPIGLDVKEWKIVEDPWWLQLLKRQELKFLPGW